MTADDTDRDRSRHRSDVPGTASIAGLLGYLVAAGFSPASSEAAELLSRHGLAPALLADPDARLPYQALMAIVAELSARDGNQDLGLRAGALGRWGFAAEYLLRQQPNLIGSYRRFIPYARLVAAPVEIRIEHRDDAFAIVGTFPIEASPSVSPALVRHGVDIWLASLTSFGRRLTGVAWTPLSVSVCYSEPSSTTSLEEFYRAPLRFSASNNELLIDARTAGLAVEAGDPAVARIIERHCDELLARTPNDGTTVAALVHTIPAAIRGGDFALATAAKALGLNARTLQRRLAGEGKSYSEILDQVRHRLALGYLGDASLSSDDIAALLGYAERRSFLRAFDRWTGTSPARMRASARRVDE